MPTIAATITDLPARARLVTWANMTTDDVGAPIDYLGNADRTAQIVGTFGGATVTMQGSNDGENWSTLNDAQGAPMAITAEGIETITELPYWIRPAVTGGTGVDVTVLLLMRSTRY